MTTLSLGDIRDSAEVLLCGDNFDDAKAHALLLADESKLTFVHPYDDDKVIAGQGTIALEMLETFPQLDTLCIAIGVGEVGFKARVQRYDE